MLSVIVAVLIIKLTAAQLILAELFMDMNNVSMMHNCISLSRLMYRFVLRLPFCCINMISQGFLRSHFIL